MYGYDAATGDAPTGASLYVMRMEKRAVVWYFD